MVLTRIKGLLIKLVGASLLLLVALSVQGHPGRTDSEGCHVGKLPRHCHGSTRSDNPAQGNQTASAKETGQSLPHKTASEDDYNRWFCATVNGETETRHGYTSASGRNYVKVDCETSTMVYEGGLDKRSSLDSVQQALFYSHVTGKRPAVVIYDTDGRSSGDTILNSGILSILKKKKSGPKQQQDNLVLCPQKFPRNLPTLFVKQQVTQQSPQFGNIITPLVQEILRKIRLIVFRGRQSRGKCMTHLCFTLSTCGWYMLTIPLTYHPVPDIA